MNQLSSKYVVDSTPELRNKRVSATKSENVMLFSTLSLIKRVLSGRHFIFHESDILDIAQDTIFRLWWWKKKYPDKANEMSESEWNSYVARTAHTR